jgi:exosortase A-associated hydrolase 1
MNFEERPVCFSCDGCWLYGVLSLPEQPAARGVLLVVGGPQYRVGSHRQFTLLARHLAAHGVPVMRFDYRGMGDSEGPVRVFEEVEEDVRAAIDQFMREVPALEELVLWGLCDAASAALFYAHKDPRVTGLVLLNPWVRTEGGIAKAYLKHYYLAHLFEPGLWKKIFGGDFDYGTALRSFSKLIGDAFRSNGKDSGADDNMAGAGDLPERMFNGFSRFKGNVLVIRSGNDLTAQEFSDLIGASTKWQRLIKSDRVRMHDLPAADHTFSRRDWRDQVAAWTAEWVRAF